jgi:hypothetical protein
MNYSVTEKNQISVSHFNWLGFRNVDGALQKDGFDGEIQFYLGHFWYFKDDKPVKKILIEKDINDIYLSQKNKSNG